MKRTVIKACGAIHIAHKINLLQQQLWNVLLTFAHKFLGQQKQFNVPVYKILECLEVTNQYSRKHILKALQGLIIKVECNLLKKDKDNKWGAFRLLEFVDIHKDICTYSYDTAVVKSILDSKMFAKISLAIQNKFRCKYALFLYELAIDYKGVKQTPWMSIDLFRKYMGLEGKEYKSFKLLNYHVIKKAVAEVNELSDVTVEVVFRRHRKKRDIKFIIIEKNTLQTQDALALSVSSKNSELETLESYGVSPKRAKQIVDSFSKEQIEEKISMMRQSNTRIKNPGAWLIKALNENWKIVKFDTVQEEVLKEKIKKRDQRQANERKLMDLQSEHSTYKQTKAEERYTSLTDDQKQQLDKQFQAWVIPKKQQAGFFILPDHIYKKSFLIDKLIEEEEQHFISWANSRGHNVKLVNKVLCLIE